MEPAGEVRDRIEWDGVAVEKLVYETEPGQAVPALLYLPTACPPPFPALVICMGHGESKTTPGPLHAGPLFARLGIACLCADPIGEEERNRAGSCGTRAHDAADVSTRSRGAGRKVIGKMVWDLMMGLGYLATRRDVDAQRLGCAGVSLGGTVAGYLLALDERLKMALPAGWFFRPEDRVIGKDCSRIPAQEMQQVMNNGELLGLAAPHCAVLVANGDADTVIDKQGSGMVAVRGLGASLEQAQEVYRLYAGAEGRIGACWSPAGGTATTTWPSRRCCGRTRTCRRPACPRPRWWGCPKCCSATGRTATGWRSRRCTARRCTSADCACRICRCGRCRRRTGAAWTPARWARRDSPWRGGWTLAAWWPARPE